MSIGRRIQEMRLRSGLTQRELGNATGLATAYLSRVENGRLIPSIPTLTRIADGLEVPISAMFDAAAPEVKDVCPVSLSGECILDKKHLRRGRKPKFGIETYTTEQLEILRLCNLLVHSRDKKLLRSLQMLIKGLLALNQSEDDAALNRSSD